ncbi:unnamed protein product [Phaeothamnion confervicola]
MADTVGGKWAGDLDCCQCRMKRLTAASFSRKQMDKVLAGKLQRSELRCKVCVEAGAQKERADAAARVAAAASAVGSGACGNGGSASELSAVFACSACQQELPLSSFSASQARKKDGRRCRECTDKAEKVESEAAAARRREGLGLTNKPPVSLLAGGVVGRFKAAMEECAAEASFVTGLRPMRGSRLKSLSGRGRGRGSGGRT